MPGEEVVELSIAETNALRVKLGLAPLRIDNGSNESNEQESTKTKKQDIHAPAPDTAKIDQAKARIEERKLAREVESKLQNNFAHTTLGADDNGTADAASWAERMRQKSIQTKSRPKAKKKNKKQADSYTSKDLEGIQVSHNASAFETNTDTILTLADESILQHNENKVTVGLNEEHESRLENVEITGTKKAKENIRKKRRIEMGQGHAGGYAAWDDDEFDEMGGIGGGMDDNDDFEKTEPGFLIGQKNDTEEGEDLDSKNSFFGRNKKVSLDSSSWQKGNVMASDFMTTEEYENEKEAKKKKKKEKGFKKSKKSKKKDSKKKHRRKKLDNDSDEEGKEFSKKNEGTKSTLLQDLESSAIEISVDHKRKRRVRDNDEDSNQDYNEDAKISSTVEDIKKTIAGTEHVLNRNQMEVEEDDLKKMQEKRAKFDAVMEKGNLRSKQAFATVTSSADAPKPTSINQKQNESSDQEDNDEADDAFLNAALAKARRLQKLKRLHGNNDNSNGNEKATDDKKAKSILEALKFSSDQNESKTDQVTGTSPNTKGITFEFDPTREFTRALRARDSQSQRQSKPKTKGTLISNVNKKKNEKESVDLDEPLNTAMDVDTDEEDIEKLSEQISTKNNDDDIDGLNFSNQSNLIVNRGLSSTLSLLKTTGSLASNDTKTSSLQEKLRGRAKDRRNYEDYESLDLGKVTSIGSSRDRKDAEFTKREIKLEYRDEYGRLLTSKEAYRQMCYQFHGHGSGKKNEERRLKLIERERMEEAGGSAGIGDGLEKREGTLGALKATQRVTGKAFIVHKT